MNIKLKDIVYETQRSWVHRNVREQCFTVFVIGATMSISDSAYPMTVGGLSLAIGRADWFNRIPGIGMLPTGPTLALAERIFKK